MEVKRILNKILALVCLITIVLPSFSEVIAATGDLAKQTTETAKFGVSLLNKNGWGYMIRDRLTYRVYEDKGSSKNYDRDVYCLDYTKSFPGAEGNNTNFTSTGDLDSSIKNKERIRLIAENMYMASMTQEEKDAALSKIFADLIERTSGDGNPVTLEFIKKTITEDDIFFAQQYAIWKYTNNLDWAGASIWMTTKENPGTNDWYQISNIGEARYDFMHEIYNYFTSNNLKSQENLTNPTLDKKEKTSVETESGYIVGPFHVKTGTNPNYKLSLSDQSGAQLTNYTIVDKDGNKIAAKLADAINKDFYVKLPLKTPATKVVLNLTYNSIKTTTKLWRNPANGTQPLMEVIKEQIPGSDNDEVIIEKPEKIYDLALRKYIVQVGERKITDRTPDIKYNEANKEITYKHKKDPIVLSAGDHVIYDITVYNEGNQKATATRIKDYLPEGLEFVKNSEINDKYGWIPSQDGTYAATAYTRAYELDGFKDGHLSSVTVQIECKVKENVKSGVLTNLAEIAEDNIEDIDSEPSSVTITQEQLPDYKGKESNKDELGDSDYFYRGQQDDDDFEKVTVEQLDLALRKYISTVNGTEQNRKPEVDVSKLKDGTATTATYKHSKEPVAVKQGDVVIYSIRVYNEGAVDAYANEITDYIPEGLGFLVNHNINYSNNWKVADPTTPQIVKLNTIPNAAKNLSVSDFENVTSLNDVDVVKGKVSVKTNKLQYGNTENLIEAFNESKTEPSSKVVQVACVVLDEKAVGNNLRNIAAITDERDKNGEKRTDRDSQPEEIDVNNYPDDKNIQDDDDYERLVLSKYDLALKKFLSSVDGKEITPSRLQKVNTVPLQNGEHDAEYTMDKSVVKVQTGKNVVYTIKVFNEGEVDTYVNEVKDNIPEGLEFVKDSEINKTYRWEEKDGKIVTDYLSEKVNPDKKLTAFNSATGEISSQEVKVEFKVVSKETKIITNIAEITSDNGDDIDSTPDNNKPEEDDQDYDNIIPAVYDLALQKFITKLGDKDITTRIPQVSTDDNGKIIYVHSKDPLTVVNKSVVIYTIRVYNEGTVEAFVEEVKDDIPEGLVYLPDHEVNKKYGWRLCDAEGNDVEKVEDATHVRTDYLSKAKSEERKEDNQLKPYDKALGISEKNPDYRDVQVAFQIDQSKMSSLSKQIKNIAEITDDDGEDIDSTPDNDEPDEDDIDDEVVELKYFDLSLLKFVTKVIVNEDGVIKETNTGHTGLENPEPVVKVELNRNKLNKTTVTFVYTIKVTNEGEIEGYAKEIKDRIPAGLEFYSEDNPGWTILQDGIVTTDLLANTLLKPGESATVEIKLRWKKDQNNLGLKVNTAEISKDENEYGTPDIDSTPDNNVDGEDDQDTAPVILSIITGSAPTYIVLTITVMTILATGFYTIKKYVL